MQAEVQLPTAFSVRNEDEFFPIQHLLARMNPDLIVTQVATGVHRNGGCTVLWGLVYSKSESITSEQVETALEDAGFDRSRGVIQELSFCAEPAMS